MKTCNKCKLSKSIDNFDLSYSIKNPNNRRHTCKLCRSEKRKKYESRFGFGLRTRNLKRKYNMTPQDYLNMSNVQNDRCYLCNKINTFGSHLDKLVVDHCHKTGKVRKLLCDKCNKGLGQFNDNAELLLKAAQYLKDHTKA